MLNAARLRVLREVAYRGSISGAAETLSYTQSAVSQQIAALEEEAGMALLDRHPRGVTLTAAGQTLLGHAETVLAGLAAAEHALAEIAGLRGGMLRLGAFPTASATLMPPAIAAFRGAYPDVGLSLVEGEPEDLVPLLRAGDLDLALVFRFPDDEEPPAEVELVALLEDPMCLALPAAHPLAGAQAVGLEQLRDEPWVQTSASSGCARHVVRRCHAAGFEPHVAFESDDYQTVQGLVAAGVGVALIPRLALSTQRGDISVRELDPAPSRLLAAALPVAGRLVPSAPAMLGVLEGVCAGPFAGLKDPGPPALRPGAPWSRPT
jgi:DNA-binding transcriptional LysR family regulator